MSESCFGWCVLVGGAADPGSRLGAARAGASESRIVDHAEMSACGAHVPAVSASGGHDFELAVLDAVGTTNWFRSSNSILTGSRRMHGDTFPSRGKSKFGLARVHSFANFDLHQPGVERVRLADVCKKRKREPYNAGRKLVARQFAPCEKVGRVTKCIFSARGRGESVSALAVRWKCRGE